MIRTDNKTLCCGCGTCVLVCPRQCIKFSEDEIGARYPSIDSDKCINCGKCESVCPIQIKKVDHQVGSKAYAAYSKNNDIRFSGSSGGMFETFANSIIKDGGTVFASKFDDNLKLKCFEAKTKEQVRTLTKSKYLQSDSSYEFAQIKKRITDGSKVLFCSTPCQVSALKKYLSDFSDKDNIFLVDFFCHGVPSQSLFDKCKAYTESKYGIHIYDYQFRTKIKNGSTPHYFTIKYIKNGKKKKKTSIYYKDPFYNGFQKYITLRECCYNCPFGKGNHVGDITIGDFHDIDRYVEGINRFDGVSTVIINTEKGENLWRTVSSDLIIHELDINKLMEDKAIYSGGSKKPLNRSEFIYDINSKEFSFIVKKWLVSKGNWKKDIYYNLPVILRKLIKKIVRL